MFEAKSIGYVSIELGRRLAPDYFRKPSGDYINPNEWLDEKAKAARGANHQIHDWGDLTGRAEYIRARMNFASLGAFQLQLQCFLH